jgi:hypothetical protein
MNSNDHRLHSLIFNCQLLFYHYSTWSWTWYWRYTVFGWSNYYLNRNLQSWIYRYSSQLYLRFAKICRKGLKIPFTHPIFLRGSWSWELKLTQNILISELHVISSTTLYLIYFKFNLQVLNQSISLYFTIQICVWFIIHSLFLPS